MTTEIHLEQPVSLTERCAALIPGFWSSEASLLIADAEPGDFQVVDTRTAEWLAASLAKEALSAIDPASEHGQKLAGLIDELAIEDDFQWPIMDTPEPDSQNPTKRIEPVELPKPGVRLAWPSDAGSIHDIAVSRARSMAPGPAYAKHAAANQKRIASGGLGGVGGLIERSEDDPRLQLAVVTHLGNLATATEDYSRLTGYMFARREPAGASYFAGEHILIHGIAVDEAQLQRGIGKTLLTFINEWQQAMFIDLPICAQVADTNTPMLRMLAHHGFERYSTEGPTASNPVRYEVMVNVNPKNTLIAA